MVAPPTYDPGAWAELAAYTRLTVLQQHDHDPSRKQVIATHLANLAPYAHTGGDAAAASIIAQHYQDEDNRLAGRPAPTSPAVADTGGELHTDRAEAASFMASDPHLQTPIGSEESRSGSTP